MRLTKWWIEEESRGLQQKNPFTIIIADGDFYNRRCSVISAPPVAETTDCDLIAFLSPSASHPPVYRNSLQLDFYCPSHTHTHTITGSSGLHTCVIQQRFPGNSLEVVWLTASQSFLTYCPFWRYFLCGVSTVWKREHSLQMFSNDRATNSVSSWLHIWLNLQYITI